MFGAIEGPSGSEVPEQGILLHLLQTIVFLRFPNGSQGSRIVHFRTASSVALSAVP